MQNYGKEKIKSPPPINPVEDFGFSAGKMTDNEPALRSAYEDPAFKLRLENSILSKDLFGN